LEDSALNSEAVEMGGSRYPGAELVCGWNEVFLRDAEIDVLS